MDILEHIEKNYELYIKIPNDFVKALNKILEFSNCSQVKIVQLSNCTINGKKIRGLINHPVSSIELQEIVSFCQAIKLPAELGLKLVELAGYGIDIFDVSNFEHLHGLFIADSDSDSDLPDFESLKKCYQKIKGTNDLSEALRYAKEWSRKSLGDISYNMTAYKSKTSKNLSKIDKDTYKPQLSKMFKDSSTLRFSSLLRLCICMNLPPEISFAIFGLSAYSRKFQYACKENFIYKYVLIHLYNNTESVREVIEPKSENDEPSQNRKRK